MNRSYTCHEGIRPSSFIAKKKKLKQDQSILFIFHEKIKQADLLCITVVTHQKIVSKAMDYFSLFLIKK